MLLYSYSVKCASSEDNHNTNAETIEFEYTSGKYIIYPNEICIYVLTIRLIK